MVYLADLMKHIHEHKWYNSFEDLAEGKMPPKELIILWNLNDKVIDIFFNTIPARKSTPTCKATASKKTDLTPTSHFKNK